MSEQIMNKTHIGKIVQPLKHRFSTRVCIIFPIFMNIHSICCGLIMGVHCSVTICSQNINSFKYRASVPSKAGRTSSVVPITAVWQSKMV